MHQAKERREGTESSVWLRAPVSGPGSGFAGQRSWERRGLQWVRLCAWLIVVFGGFPQVWGAGVEARVEGLLRQMTLPEKVGQMTQVDLGALKDRSEIARLGLGSVLCGGNTDPEDNEPATWRRTVVECQQWALQSRLKIPLLFGVDAVHGHNNVLGAVIFPHQIGLGATRNPRLVEEAARVTAGEMLATGISWAFAPCLAVAQDPRWGRTYESYSDDPELVGRLGAAAVRGIQGARRRGPWTALACAKHYVGDGGTTGGVDQGNTECDEATLRRVHLAPYREAIRAGVGSVMASYSSWNGVKLHGHRYLLTEVLKGELGFDGFVVSDWAAIDQLSPSYKEAIERAINAGVDMVMIPNGPGQPNHYHDFLRLLEELVREGRVPEGRIDDAVRRILRVKVRLGLFEQPIPSDRHLGQVGSAQHRAVARRCVQESLVLLKNERESLPLSKQVRHLHLVGPAADDLGLQCGGWTISWQGSTGAVTRGGTTLLQAVRGTVSARTRVTHSVDVAEGTEADVIVVVLAEPPYAEMMGDRKDLNLPEDQRALVRRARATGKRVVTVLYSGRPLILGSALEDSDAFVAAWLPGTEGQGIAEVLFGDYRPTGRLPRVWPKDNQRLASAEAAVDPMFPRGYGLTYGARGR
jgi:beta-glucosidase